MRKWIGLLLFISLLPSMRGQPSNNWEEKYQTYRTRFRTHFISIGEGAGRSIPFARVTCEDDQTHVIRGGESTFLLGTYIGFLGTEYLVLKRRNQDLRLTIQELYYAVEALNRLDLYAETYNSYDRAPALDGFFVREDIPNDFEADALYGQDQHWLPQRGYTQGEGSVYGVDEVYETKETHCYQHTPMSQDHTIRILWGLYLAHHCLDSGIQFEGKALADGEKDLRQGLQNCFNRIITKCVRDGWTLRDPMGQEVANCQSKTGKIFTFKNNLLDAYHQLNQMNQKRRSRPVWARFVAGVGQQTGWINTRMWLETRNLSGEQGNTWKFAHKYGYETYFLPYGMIVHNWKWSEQERTALKARCAYYLETAPAHGPFFHSPEDFGADGWACADRTERSLKYQYLGVGHVRGNFSGLDYLLLYNLYHLAFPEVNPLSADARRQATFLTSRSQERERVQATLTSKERMMPYYQKQIQRIEAKD
ncbi:MAG: hypothetical protein AAFU33_24775 [Bacteroidota bacterium]